MTINGVSTCQKRQVRKSTKVSNWVSADESAHLCSTTTVHPTDGELFSCVKPTLDECRDARDKWLTAKERKGGQTINAPTAYQTLIVKFSEPIKVLDGILEMPKRGEWQP